MFQVPKWDPDHTSAQCKGQRACVWCAADHFHRGCAHFQGKSRENAKCANCNEAHPAWSKNCAVFIAASKNSSKASTARIVSSASVNKADLGAEVQTAMASIWEALAKVVATVVSRAVLDLDVELKKPKMDKGGLAMRTVANTVKAINECGLLHPSRQLEVASIQQNVWKDVFSQDSSPQSSQASSAPINNKGAPKS